jgi:N-acetylglucosamine-6-phosphate deacetylase
MTAPNELICFTNCLLPSEDGSLVEQDLWIDERKGIVLDSQVCEEWSARILRMTLHLV